ncbi:hypothetical protein [Bradyrhizobium niftali]|jgi:hypothetical protein|uniref:Uncharacterized protein n=1 Tax=Bradyrhizobium niftali TaxID=2560055 RepID=A0A4Y9M291_9BRAD|nr:hypothetical protein [Bradyrhizobium niftali]TFV49235.1 hypothetical protein E4K65_09995 [Bradyrhizobium niftali]
MTNGQDTNTKAQAEPGQSPKDVAQNTNVSSTPEKDALGDSSLDDVSGGSWPYLTSSYSSGGMQGG